MLTKTTDKKQNYKLEMSDGKVWEFISTTALNQWLKLFAKTMELKKVHCSKNTYKKIIFSKFVDGNIQPQNTIISKDWKLFKHASIFKIWTHEKINEVFIELNYDFIEHPEIKYIDMWSSLIPLFSHYNSEGGGPIHAASAEFNGNGIIIAASGGTGKSTCYNRLPAYWHPMADDEALIVKEQKKYHIHPMPTWSDYLFNRKIKICNSDYYVPLKGIFFLEQSKEDSVENLTKNLCVHKLHNALREPWESYWVKTEKEARAEMSVNVFHNACEIISSGIPCYKLKATLHGKFWEGIEKIFNC